MFTQHHYAVHFLSIVLVFHIIGFSDAVAQTMKQVNSLVNEVACLKQAVNNPSKQVINIITFHSEIITCVL